jgi:topoisomerase-4 subunit A
MLVAASDGRGFLASQDEMIGTTRKGKLLLNVEKPVTALCIVPAEGDHVAVIGDNRKLLIFPLDQVPAMARGKGVRLQKYRDGGLSDVKIFQRAEGLNWMDSAGRRHILAAAEFSEWIGNRADAGRTAPRGFPRNNKFT